MHQHVLVQISFLRKYLMASTVSAPERPFLCVRPEMVEKIVPLAENHLAALDITLHQSVPPIRAWILELYHLVLLRLGH
jgi:hypothetical protein